MAVDLTLLRNDIAAHLIAIEDLLAPEYKLTLIARHTKNEKAHIILTVDDLAKACAAALRTEAAPDTSTLPGAADSAEGAARSTGAPENSPGGAVTDGREGEGG